MKYQITSRDHGRWIDTTCQTLAGAKRKCTSEFGAGSINDILLVAEVRNGKSFSVAMKNNCPGAKWEEA